MHPGETIAAGGRQVTLDDVFVRDGPNYGETVARFTVREGGTVVAVMEPTKRRFAARQMETTETAIKTFGAAQLYLSLGDISPEKAVVVRAYWKPMVTFIWLGALVMAAGGVLSLSDRRLRVGAPAPGAEGRRGTGGVGADEAALPRRSPLCWLRPAARTL